MRERYVRKVTDLAGGAGGEAEARVGVGCVVLRGRGRGRRAVVGVVGVRVQEHCTGAALEGEYEYGGTHQIRSTRTARGRLVSARFVSRHPTSFASPHHAPSHGPLVLLSSLPGKHIQALPSTPHRCRMPANTNARAFSRKPASKHIPVRHIRDTPRRRACTRPPRAVTGQPSVASHSSLEVTQDTVPFNTPP